MARRANVEDFTEWGRSIHRRLEELGRTQAWLGAEVARLEGRDNPYHQSTVRGWLLGEFTMAPTQVFAAEEVLGLRPGTLSRPLGYLPTSARSVVTVEEALAADPSLTDQHRAAVLALYRTLAAPGQ